MLSMRLTARASSPSSSLFQQPLETYTPDATVSVPPTALLGTAHQSKHAQAGRAMLSKRDAAGGALSISFPSRQALEAYVPERARTEEVGGRSGSLPMRHFLHVDIQFTHFL